MSSGYIDTPRDERDYPVCMAYEDFYDVEVPKNFRTSYQPPYEKQVAGNCVAQSLANIMEVMWYKMIGEHDDFSVGFIYGNRKAGQNKSEGMTGYAACGNLCKDGDVKAAVYEDPSEVPFIIEDVERFKEEHPRWAEQAYVPKSYIRTNSTDVVKKFITKYDIPVMAICEVNDFWIGGGLHAMALYGWDGDTAIMQNSWGEKHKAKIVELPFDDIKEFWLIMPYSVMNFKDIDETHWAYNYIAKCVTEEVMLGYPDGTIRPNKNMTRAELAALIYRMMKQ